LKGGAGSSNVLKIHPIIAHHLYLTSDENLISC
jgi:hypothetical protein